MEFLLCSKVLGSGFRLQDFTLGFRVLENMAHV